MVLRRLVMVRWDFTYDRQCIDVISGMRFNQFPFSFQFVDLQHGKTNNKINAYLSANINRT